MYKIISAGQRYTFKKQLMKEKHQGLFQCSVCGWKDQNFDRFKLLEDRTDKNIPFIYICEDCIKKIGFKKGRLYYEITGD